QPAVRKFYKFEGPKAQKMKVWRFFIKLNTFEVRAQITIIYYQWHWPNTAKDIMDNVLNIASTSLQEDPNDYMAYIPLVILHCICLYIIACNFLWIKTCWTYQIAS
ncbi:MAG: hypothetical protein EZS28_014895, partial [Streblomastix strix]